VADQDESWSAFICCANCCSDDGSGKSSPLNAVACERTRSPGKAGYSQAIFADLIHIPCSLFAWHESTNQR